MRHVPKIVVRMLVFGLTTQEMCIRWGNSLSTGFTVVNGVRQGSILSSILFNVYMDDLSMILSKCHKGCHINGMCVNHLIYADDICLLAPSAKGLQYLLNKCETFRNENCLTFNVENSVCMLNESKAFKFKCPNVFLNNVRLNYVESYKYLGHYICNSFKDNHNIRNQPAKVFARACLRTYMYTRFRTYMYTRMHMRI